MDIHSPPRSSLERTTRDVGHSQRSASSSSSSLVVVADNAYRVSPRATVSTATSATRIGWRYGWVASPGPVRSSAGARSSRRTSSARARGVRSDARTRRRLVKHAWVC
mmetsp:Transcript_785/g.2514  ORF Transcript_785/g.2514 Transcript_785/m.2514 type:complete len:108 (+) Transcript_785:861-1184(+)